MTSAHVSFTKAGIASIRNISDFLERSGLSPFVASSFSAQRNVSEQLDKKIIEFAEKEEERMRGVEWANVSGYSFGQPLKRGMSHRENVNCQHPNDK
ncbi:hypothetical protein DSCO28_48000 [Desulfosarcina ovata subsp. sediminis]|uniref:Uncharacterized protein n=3 Tax=Desulfosarcina ovata TaxID=83564 RepID=A0A5K8ADQ7_9BACT|nr:hypothetical protein DSCO28_48000 [Desulfosarcina ovata subsp. sediminis]BBO90745.1 hypothetical protein DSCOOX_39250 [Desulfosarcina ovata subsp. ovata]